MDKYYLNIPYPSYDHLIHNNQYADIILSLTSGLNSKMSAISLYFYNSIIISNTEIKEAMDTICTTEIYHLKILSDIAYLLGADPRLWESRDDCFEYWSPSYNIYSLKIKDILKHAIIKEQYFIHFYKHQLNSIDDPVICKVLNRLLLDDQLHLEIFKKLLEDQS